MFLSMSAIAGIGFLIKFTLIPGQDRWIKYGRNVDLYLFGMDRHEWGTIHLIIGFILLGLLVLHIILHWYSLTCVFNRIFKRKLVKKIIALLMIVISAFLIIVPFLVKPKTDEIEQGKGRQTTNFNGRTKRENKTITTYEKENLNNANSFEIHDHSNPSIEVRGYMTLDEVSKKYKVPTEFIKTRLNIPKSIPDKQRLGWLRKKYDFRMSEVEEIINEYQENNFGVKIHPQRRRQ